MKDETNLLQIYVLDISELRCTEIWHFEYHTKEKSQSISMMWSWTYIYHSRVSEIALKPWTSLIENQRNCEWSVILYFILFCHDFFLFCFYVIHTFWNSFISYTDWLIFTRFTNMHKHTHMYTYMLNLFKTSEKHRSILKTSCKF